MREAGSESSKGALPPIPNGTLGIHTHNVDLDKKGSKSGVKLPEPSS